MAKNREFPGYAWGRHAFGRLRMPIAHLLDNDSKAMCEELLLRALALFEEQCPDLSTLLFGGRPLALAGNSEISFAAGEPAINVYSEGGGLKPHEDKQSLTILIVLSDACEFRAGGTAFWADAHKSGNSPRLQPTLVLKPLMGTALCFGGSVTHSAVRVLAGQRCVFVASFSRSAANKQEDARWDPLLGWNLATEPPASPPRPSMPSGHAVADERCAMTDTARDSETD